MHHKTPYGANAYRAIGIETGVAAADPLGLVVMLYDGAIHAIVRAETHLDKGEIEARGTYALKAIDIINQGLVASLDKRIGGTLAEGLASLYEYMARRLFAANLQADRAIFEEVRGLLSELREAWITLREEQASGKALAFERMRPGNRSADSIVASGWSATA